LTSPTARSLGECRRLGWTAQVVERWNPHSKTRLDLFGGVDILALDGLPGCLGIQATTTAHAAAREAKLRAEPRMAAWLAAGNRLEVWAWAKLGARGKRKLWTLTRRPLEPQPPTLVTSRA
jgi:hypothetical protein